MALTANSLIERLAVRFKAQKSHWIQIGAGEVASWPDGFFAMIEPYLAQGEPARTIACDGCEQACFQPVHIYPQDGNRAAVAFIACDQREDTARIRVDFARLRQWQLTLESFEKFQIQNVLPHDAESTDKPRKTKAPKLFQDGLRDLLIEIEKRAKSKGVPFNTQAMPGRKADFQDVAGRYDKELGELALSTFSGYLKGVCMFTRGSRKSGFYRDLFPECFKQ